MEIIKDDFSQTKGIPPSGLCVGVHRAGAIHQKMVQKYGEGLSVWSLRPDLDFVAFKKEGLGEKGIRATDDLESIRGEKLIYGVRGAPPQVRQKAQELGLELLADATCPFVTQQEEAAEELLQQGYNLVLLSSRTHSGRCDCRNSLLTGARGITLLTISRPLASAWPPRSSCSDPKEVPRQDLHWPLSHRAE